MQSNDFPILEFDSSPRAVIEPSEVFKSLEISEHCVMCFFKDVVDNVVQLRNAEVIFEDKGCYGTNQFYQFSHNGRKLVLFNPIVGAPLAAAFLEIAIALGCRKIIVCGSSGVLDKSIPVGEFIVPDSAVRDEGTSYHYIEPDREIAVCDEALSAIVSTLKDRNELFRMGKTWTTDGFFRETAGRVARRKAEGCIAVEMEAAALLAVAKFRNVPLGYILTGGDDVSSDEWDPRAEVARIPSREKMFWIAVESCLKL